MVSYPSALTERAPESGRKKKHFVYNRGTRLTETHRPPPNSESSFVFVACVGLSAGESSVLYPDEPVVKQDSSQLGT